LAQAELLAYMDLTPVAVPIQFLTLLRLLAAGAAALRLPQAVMAAQRAVLAAAAGITAAWVP
jgi:hypothetical protein